MAMALRVFVGCGLLVLPTIATNGQTHQNMSWSHDKVANATASAAKKAVWGRHTEKEAWAKKEARDARSEFQVGAKAVKEAWVATKAAWSPLATEGAWTKMKKAWFQQSNFEDEVEAKKDVWAAKKEAWARDTRSEFQGGAKAAKKAWAATKAAWSPRALARTSLRGHFADKKDIAWSKEASDSEMDEDDNNGYSGYGSGQHEHQQWHKHGHKHGQLFAAFPHGSLKLLLLLAMIVVAAMAAFVAMKRCRGQRTVRMVTADGVLLASAPPADEVASSTA